MSIEIIYDFQAMRLPAEFQQYGSDQYLLFLLAGSSNCYEDPGGNARRSRSWQLYAAGQDYSVLSKVCELSGDCCGGMLVYKTVSHKGGYCLPETIIRAARKAIEGAVDGFDAMVKKGFRIALKTRISEGAARNGCEDQFDRLMLAKEAQVETRYDTKLYAWNFDWKNPEDLKLWFDNITGNPSSCVEVSGPGD